MTKPVKKGDIIVVTKDGYKNITKGKQYKVLYVHSGWCGAAVSFLDDNHTLTCVNGLWWDFPPSIERPLPNTEL